MFVGTDSWIYRSGLNGSQWGGAGDGPDGDITSLVATRNGYVFASNFSSSYDVYGNLTSSTASILRSTEDSVSFSPVNNGLPSSQYSGQYILGTDSAGYIFAVNDSSGIFHSTDNGNNWTPVNSGLSNIHTYSIAVSPTGYMFVGAGDGLVYRSSHSTITAVTRAEITLPQTFLLNQNYPNPFNPSTTISFSLPRQEFATLKIFDLMGREITTLISKNLAAGNYSLKWDAVNQPSGVYFYRLQAGQYSETRKLLLLK